MSIAQYDLGNTYHIFAHALLYWFNIEYIADNWTDIVQSWAYLHGIQFDIGNI